MWKLDLVIAKKKLSKYFEVAKILAVRSIERAQSEIAWKVTKIHLWQGSMKITFYCFAHRRKVKPPFDIMRAQTRLQANYERNSYKFPRILVKLKFLRKKYHTNVSSRGQNSSLVEFPLGVWSFRCNFHVRSIKCFQLGKTDHDFIPVPSSNVSCLTLSRRHEFSAKQTTNQTSVFIRKQRSLCILLHPQARIFRCVKFSKLIPTAKPMGKEVFTSRKSLVKLPKFMHNERDLSPVKYHNRIKRHLLPWPSLPEYPVTPIKM